MNSHAQKAIKVGISACLLHADRERRQSVFNGRPLAYIETSIASWITRGGATPLMLPPPEAYIHMEPYSKVEAKEAITQVLDAVDCLILHGGVDVAPESYGQKPLKSEWSGDWIRDQFELALFHEAMEQNKPVLGICRGHQLINVALGGSLYQDIFTQVHGAIPHRCSDRYQKLYHDVELIQGSTLSQIYANQTKGRINSVHHQAICDLAPGLIVEAVSKSDSVIEAVIQDKARYPEHYIRGIQWHPEFQTPQDDHEEASLLDPMPVLQDLLAAVILRREKKTS